jgi:hypothetical protein
VHGLGRQLNNSNSLKTNGFIVFINYSSVTGAPILLPVRQNQNGSAQKFD